MSRTRVETARAIARDIPPGSVVNLGIGLPVTVVEHWDAADEVIVHSENGILGMRALAPGAAPDPDLVNAGKQPVGLVPGAAIFHHADSFAMMRGGHLDYCVLGAYQVAATGDLANWSLGRPDVAAAVGGAMDLAVGAKRVFVFMDHLTKDGESRLVESCTLPLTGVGSVTRVYTDLATLDVTPAGFRARELAPGVTPAQLQEVTAAPVDLRGVTHG
ncbi:3-oxoacid CoA-transferase subunit B [Saccharomonospora sp. NPDC046836]|uniref:3-oxoacid CoA-transferase subunit B n=1 Tax=Saccharomonospora sp. NPDC046836 TaxID=3156921 RepID=UPI0033C24448